MNLQASPARFASLIFRRRDHLKVIWVNTAPVKAIIATLARIVAAMTDVVPFHVAFWPPHKIVVRKAPSSPYPEATVTPGVNSGRPMPAGISLLDFGPETFIQCSVTAVGVSSRVALATPTEVVHLAPTTGTSLPCWALTAKDGANRCIQGDKSTSGGIVNHSSSFYRIERALGLLVP